MGGPPAELGNAPPWSPRVREAGGCHFTICVPIATHPRLLISASSGQDPKVEVALV